MVAQPVVTPSSPLVFYVTILQTMEQTILIVEDDDNMAGLERRLLEKEGFRVIVTSGGNEALKVALSDSLIDLMIIDYRLPDMSGVDLMRKINASRERAVPSIMLTAAGSESVAVSAMKLGAMDYIVKDIETVMRLPDICQEVLRKSSLAEENRQLMERLKVINDELMESNKKLEDLSRRDDLTGLFNRRYLMEVLEHECARSRRYGTTLSFALFDLDRFKAVNDTYGHPFGDEVLRHIASVFIVRLRQTDRVFRYGGEEFGVVFADTGLDEALRVCDELREKVSASLFRKDDITVGIKVSAGIATMQEHMSREDLIEKADESLYAAKQGGRDRVVALEAEAEA
jgi:diguanylate cyclase (GGDEF)-like protein